MVNVFSWIALSAGAFLLVAQLILAFPIFYNANYLPPRWQYFLVYQAVNFVVILVNCFVIRHAMWLFTLTSKPLHCSQLFDLQGVYTNST